MVQCHEKARLRQLQDLNATEFSDQPIPVQSGMIVSNPVNEG